ncbi:hypothetical protein BOW53_04050 [Solemya pervernicosa gill symbiont]|uniref:Chemotaxis methyl-accepting receptor HlyB-like 4HB MCP domain-containing protein n=1 Tax=Solemya pervernicosa gill symbiont TaxID=642797 RepID=A0A1T2L892_9GAMM|nr:hypothetical protein [Solemya pervernicosa gill symbiont]OOZ41303.1 hypothetical protein BOW53_04050 [Solemya pervernicosa gill symbiont]
MKLNITRKISLLSVLLVFCTAGMVAWVFYVSSNAILIKNKIEQLSFGVQQDGVKLVELVDSVQQDVRFISDLSSIDGIIQAHKAPDPDQVITADWIWRQRLSDADRHG